MPTKPRTLRPPGGAVLCVAPEYPKVGTLVFFALCLNIRKILQERRKSGRTATEKEKSPHWLQGCTISRFISGAKGTLTHEQVLRIARLFNVSTDFLLGETNIPDRKNYDIAELGLSVEAAKNLYTGRVNAEVVNLLLENARFAELTYRISQYFDDTFASGIAAQNAMLTTLSTLLRTKVKTPEAAKAAKDISLRRKPVYQGDLDDIEMYFMAAVKEIKKGIGSHYAEQEAMSKKVAEKMFNELTKGQDVQHPTITAEQLTDAMLDSVSGMEGATPEALEQLRSGLLGILQSAAEQENAHEADE